MAHTNTTTAIKTLLASALLASGIGALTPLAIATTTTAAPVAEIHDPVINTDTEEQLELVSWALGCFEEAAVASHCGWMPRSRGDAVRSPARVPWSGASSISAICSGFVESE
jgi:hypothetical protein